MTDKSTYVITISRQLGSGGGKLGQRLAKRLGILYLDRDILRQAAERLGEPEKTLEWRDENVTSLWQSISQSSALTLPFGPYVPMAQVYSPTDRELYNVESEIIQQIAREKSAVIVGRGGFHVLREHARHLSVFVHADRDIRQQRVQDQYNVLPAEALEMVETTDRARSRYLHTLAGRDWTDASQYHICLDTGVLGLDVVEELVVSCARARFGADLK